MYKEERITQKAISLGFNSVDIKIIYGTKEVEQVGFRIDQNFPGQEKEIKELNKFILELEYEKCVNEMIPDVKIIYNQINL